MGAGAPCDVLSRSVRDDYCSMYGPRPKGGVSYGAEGLRSLELGRERPADRCALALTLHVACPPHEALPCARVTVKRMLERKPVTRSTTEALLRGQEAEAEAEMPGEKSESPAILPVEGGGGAHPSTDILSK